MNVKAIGGFFRGARLARGLKPEEVSLAMAEVLDENVSVSTVYKIEGGRMNPSLERVLALLYVLKVNPRPLIELAQGDATAAQAERVGRQAALDDEDIAWLERLSPEQRRRARRYVEAHPE